MKFILTFIVMYTLIFITVISCTKSTDNSSKSQPTKKWYRVAAIGNDTVYSKAMNARDETGPIAMTENQKLRCELMSYTSIGNGMARYELRITNRQECRMILRWNWEKINPTSIEPIDGTQNSPLSDVIAGNSTKTYIMIAKATIGALMVKGEQSGTGGCENTSQLRLNITLDILPVKFVSCDAHRDASKNYDLFVNYTIETPEDANTFEIQESENGKDYHSIYSFASDKKTKVYSIRIPNTNS
jgi:hypothetical protein